MVLSRSLLVLAGLPTCFGKSFFSRESSFISVEQVRVDKMLRLGFSQNWLVSLLGNGQ